MSHFSLFLLFLRFGFLAWGGPVAQIAMLREELVERQKWIDKDKFNRVLAVYQALPGPEAHELCVYFGMIKKGRWGGFLAGLGFMLPGFFLILLLSAAYKFYGATVLLPFFVGITPAVVALIVRATHRIGEHILSTKSLFISCGIAVILTLLGVHFFWIFFICAIWQYLYQKDMKKIAFSYALISIGFVITLNHFIPELSISWGLGNNLFIEGLKAGLLSFGGAYTAIPFLKNTIVDTYPSVTLQVFMDGIALSNIIPAPLVIFGTYLGFMADGLWGAILVTLGIFIPAFAFTLAGHRWLEKIIENPALHGFLDGIASAVVGLLAVTTIHIFISSINSFYSLLFFILALLAFYFLKGKWIVPAVILVSGIVGYFLSTALQ